jgi:hypothetical protein
MDAGTPGRDHDALGSLPAAELRRLVYAQGADETDERWIRAAAELTRRERAALPSAGSRPGDPDGSEDDGDPPSADAARPSPARPDRRVLTWAGTALLVGLLAGAAIGTGVDGAEAPGAGGTATTSPPTPEPSGSVAAEPPDPASVRSLLGTDIRERSRSVAIADVLDAPREEADSPPRSPYGDVDLSSIRGVQTSVGLYAARTISGDLCLLVYPWTGARPVEGASPGSGIASCVSPAQLAVSGLHVTWVADVPSRAVDGSVTMSGGELTATLGTDGTITLLAPSRLVAY